MLNLEVMVKLFWTDESGLPIFTWGFRWFWRHDSMDLIQ